MAREQDNKPTWAAEPPPELEQSGPVFDRARRLAGALFGEGGAQAAIVVVGPEGETWRDRVPQGASPRAPGARWVIEHGELLWVEDASKHPLFADHPMVLGPPYARFYVGAPIRLDDGTIPAALVFGSPTPRPYDKALAERLQDLADFVADEWVRIRVARAQQRADRERDAANSTLAGVVRSAPLLLALTDREMRLVDASPGWLARRGRVREEVIGRTIFEIDPDSTLDWRNVLERALAGEPYENPRARIGLPGGACAWMNASVAPWRDAGGDIAGLIIVAHDITTMVEAMEATARSEERLKLAVDMANLYVWELDYISRKIVRVGDERAFFDSEVRYGDLVADIWGTIDPQDRPAVKAAWAQFMADGTPYRPEYRINRKDGREVWTSTAVKAVRDEHGKTLRLVGAMQDVTKRKAQERALIQAKNDAEAANRAKSSFLATVSHEIRTPLNGLMGMVQAMARGELSPVQRERLEVIRSSSEGLLAILNELLDLSKIEAGKLTLEDGRFEVGELAKGVFATFQGVAENKGVGLEVTVSRAARGAYRGDPMRVRQILNNLLSNALKFTDRGVVRVAVSRRGGALQIEVADTGIGMSQVQQQNLFRAFEQAEASTSRRYGGTGLGLSICRELVELMGGHIAVRSEAGKGTRFTVRLPLEKAAAAAAASSAPVSDDSAHDGPAADSGADRPVRLLAAEDNSVNQLVLKTLLDQAGVEPVIVGDGAAAVEAWAREPWDVILMDVQMPVMDGLAATAEIRAREQAEGRRRTPIIALTANAMGDQIARYLAAGMDGHVAKPIAASRLFAALQAALALAQDGKDAAEAAA